LFFTYQGYIFTKTSMKAQQTALIRMDFGTKMMSARKQQGLSREGLGQQIGTSGAIIGRYERGDMKPSIEIAAKIAQALEVSLDYLVGITSEQLKDQTMLRRLDDLRQLDEDKQRTLFDLMDTYIRDYKTRKAFAS
jgi:ribosome-binding protein aMBF1 (putative translation factor)